MLPLILITIVLVGSLTFLLGQHLGFQLGYDLGRLDGEAHAEDPDISAIRWRLAAPEKHSEF